MSEIPNLPIPLPVGGDRPLLLAVEDANDILFLKHLSQIVGQLDSATPDLEQLELSGRLACLPWGAAAFWPGPSDCHPSAVGNSTSSIASSHLRQLCGRPPLRGLILARTAVIY